MVTQSQGVCCRAEYLGGWHMACGGPVSGGGEGAARMERRGAGGARACSQGSSSVTSRGIFCKEGLWFEKDVSNQKILYYFQC